MGNSFYGNFAECKSKRRNKKKGEVKKGKQITNEEVRGRAYGELNLTVRDFELLTYREFELYWNGYLRRENDKWKHTREILAFISNSRMGVKHPISGAKLMPFEEEKEEQEEQSFQELLNMIK